MLKKGPNKKLTLWRKRYFNLLEERQKLNYYEDENMSEKDLLGTCDLATAVGVRSIDYEMQTDVPPYGIEIFSEDRIWQLAVENEVEREWWLTALSIVVPDEVYCDGYMWKAGGRNTSMKKRYFALHQNGLAYFENEDKSTYIGTVDLSSAINIVRVEDASGEEEAKDAVFGIQIVCMTAQRRIWHLRTETDEERERWIDELSRFVPQFTTHTYPVRGGFLVKRGERIKTWKKRFFALVDGVALYFSDVNGWKKLLEEEEERRNGNKPKNFISTAPSGVFSLRGGELLLEERDDDFQIAVRVPNRTYFLQASDEGERRRWVSSLSQCLFMCPFQRKNVLTNELYRDFSSKYIVRDSSGEVVESHLPPEEEEKLPQAPPHMNLLRQKLSETLRHPTLCKFFQQYFILTWSKESEAEAISPHLVEFWFDAELFRRMTVCKFQIQMGLSIYKTYFSHGAPKKIHLDWELQQVLLFRLNSPTDIRHKLPSDLFRALQNRVLDMLAVDVYPHFLRSKCPSGFTSACNGLFTDVVLQNRLLTYYNEVMKDEESEKHRDNKMNEMLMRSESFMGWLVQQSQSADLHVAQKGVFARNALLLWRELRELHFLPSSLRASRTISIIEDFIRKGAPRFVRLPDELVNEIYARLDDPASPRVFCPLQGVLFHELRDHHVMEFMKSELHRRAGLQARMESKMNPVALPDQAPPNGRPFADIIFDTNFRKFLVSAQREQYWRCWKELESFRTFPQQSTRAERESMGVRAERLYSAYFSPTSEVQLEIACLGATREDVLRAFRKVSPDMFVGLQEKLQRYLQIVLFDEFRSSPMYSDDVEKDVDVPPYNVSDFLGSNRQRRGATTILPPPTDAIRNMSLSGSPEDIVPPPPPEDGLEPFSAQFPRTPSGSVLLPPPVWSYDSDDDSVGGSPPPPPPPEDNPEDPPPPVSPSFDDGDDDGNANSPKLKISSSMSLVFKKKTGRRLADGEVSDGEDVDSEDEFEADSLLPFSLVVGEPFLTRHFRAFLASGPANARGCLEFYCAVEEFSRMKMGGDAQVSAIAAAVRTRIYSQFLSEAAPVSVAGVEVTTRKEANRRLHEPVRPWMFNQAQDEAFAYLRKNFYAHFQRSRFYRDLKHEYFNFVRPRSYSGIFSHWSPSRKSDTSGLANLACGNACWGMFFKAFLAKQWCTESFDFFHAVDDFRYLQGVTYRLLRARGIWEKFLSNHSEFQVNIGSTMQSEILESLSKNDCPPWLLNRAQEEVFHLMETGKMKDYLGSDEFKAYSLSALPEPSKNL